MQLSSTAQRSGAIRWLDRVTRRSLDTRSPGLASLDGKGLRWVWQSDDGNRGGDERSRTLGGRAMSTITQSIDVEVPVTTAYNQWTQFESFPHFMEGVEEI